MSASACFSGVKRAAVDPNLEKSANSSEEHENVPVVSRKSFEVGNRMLASEVLFCFLLDSFVFQNRFFAFNGVDTLLRCSFRGE